MASHMRKPADFVGYTEGYSVRAWDFKPAMAAVTMENKLLGFHGLTFQFVLQAFGVGAGENDFVGIADGIPFADDNVSELVNLCGVHCSGSFLVKSEMGEKFRVIFSGVISGQYCAADICIRCADGENINAGGNMARAVNK